MTLHDVAWLCVTLHDPPSIYLGQEYRKSAFIVPITRLRQTYFKPMIECHSLELQTTCFLDTWVLVSNKIYNFDHLTNPTKLGVDDLESYPDVAQLTNTASPFAVGQPPKVRHRLVWGPVCTGNFWKLDNWIYGNSMGMPLELPQWRILFSKNASRFSNFQLNTRLISYSTKNNIDINLIKFKKNYRWNYLYLEILVILICIYLNFKFFRILIKYIL